VFYGLGCLCGSGGIGPYEQIVCLPDSSRQVEIVEGDSEPCGLSGYQAVVLDGTCASSSYGGLACFAACDAGIDRISALAQFSRFEKKGDYTHTGGLN